MTLYFCLTQSDGSILEDDTVHCILVLPNLEYDTVLYTVFFSPNLMTVLEDDTVHCILVSPTLVIALDDDIVHCNIVSP
jgi:hypothetical protein